MLLAMLLDALAAQEKRVRWTLITEAQKGKKIEIARTKTATKMDMKSKQGTESLMTKFRKHK